MHFRLCKKTIVDCQADSPKPLVPTPPSPAPIKSQKVIKKGQRLTIKSWVVHHVQLHYYHNASIQGRQIQCRKNSMYVRCPK